MPSRHLYYHLLQSSYPDISSIPPCSPQNEHCRSAASGQHCAMDRPDDCGLLKRRQVYRVRRTRRSPFALV